MTSGHPVHQIGTYVRTYIYRRAYLSKGVCGFVLNGDSNLLSCCYCCFILMHSLRVNSALFPSRHTSFLSGTGIFFSIHARAFYFFCYDIFSCFSYNSIIRNTQLLLSGRIVRNRAFKMVISTCLLKFQQ